MKIVKSELHHQDLDSDQETTKNLLEDLEVQDQVDSEDLELEVHQDQHLPEELLLLHQLLLLLVVSDSNFGLQCCVR